MVLKNGLQPVKAPSVKLQKRATDIYKAYGYINFVTKEVQSMCVNGTIAEHVEVTIDTPRTTKVQRNRANAR